jgi:hypothetical protein
MDACFPRTLSPQPAQAAGANADAETKVKASINNFRLDVFIIASFDEFNGPFRRPA